MLLFLKVVIHHGTFLLLMSMFAMSYPSTKCEEVDINAGLNTTFACDIRSQRVPNREVYWMERNINGVMHKPLYRNDVSFKESEGKYENFFLSMDDMYSNVSIIGADVCDDGNYICCTECTTNGDMIRRYKLTVNAPPRSVHLSSSRLIGPSNLTVNENERVNISCEAVDTKPAVRLEWKSSLKSDSSWKEDQTQHPHHLRCGEYQSTILTTTKTTASFLVSRRHHRYPVICQVQGSPQVQDSLMLNVLFNYCDTPSISNGVFNSTSHDYGNGTTVIYQCNKFYELVGTATRICHADGTWSGVQPYCVPICGQSIVPPTTPQPGRIVDGQNAAAGSWPWMVHLQIRAPTFLIEDAICGGSLLNEEWVVTAAHCVTGKKPELKFVGLYGEIVPQNSITASLGLHKRNQSDEHVVQRTFDAIVRHTVYDVDKYDADIALLHLRDPVELTDRIRPICLPNSLDDIDEFSSAPDANQQATAITIGWGKICQSWWCPYPQTLKEAYVPLVDRQTCQAAGMSLHITRHMICAGFEQGGRDSCQGDSGGPLMLPETPGSSTYIMHGIVSWGNGCARPWRYGVYVKAVNFVDWIYENTNVLPPVACSTPLNISNGIFTSTTNDYTYGITITYQCNALYKLVGTATRICQANGTWSGVQPSCNLLIQRCGTGLGPAGGNNALGRIVGGNNAPDKAWPWMVGIYYWPSPGSSPVYFCGGSLLSPDLVLTAAHCFRPVADRQPQEYEATDLIIAVGSNEFLDSADQVMGRVVVHNFQVLKVADDGIIAHAEFNTTMGSTDFDYDVALLQLKAEVELNSAVNTICLPDQEDFADLTRKGEGARSQPFPYVTGWGSTRKSNPNHADVLQQLALPLKGTTTCRKRLGRVNLEGAFTNNMYCAGFTRGEQTVSGEVMQYTGEFGSCQGDSGSPMVRQKASGDDDTWYQIGIVSWGFGCAQRGQYDYYTDVTKFVDWIHSKTMS